MEDLKAKDTIDQRRSMVQAALSKKYDKKTKKGGKDCCVPCGYWCQELFDNYAIVERGGKLFAFPYSIKGQEAATGEPFLVEKVYREVKTDKPTAKEQWAKELE